MKAACRLPALRVLMFASALLSAGAEAVPAPTQAEEHLRILAVEEPPASFAGSDGKPAGYAIDVLREIQRRVGNSDPVFIEPETRVYESGLRSPNVVLLSFSRTAEREDSFFWIARIIHKPWIFYARADDVRAVTSLEDVKALKGVAVVAGDVRARWLQKQNLQNLLPAQSHEQAMRLLLARRVDAVFSEPQGVAWFCRVKGCGGQPPRALWSPKSSDVYIMMSRSGTSPALAARWQEAADAAMADGTVEAIARRWSETSVRDFGIQAVWREGVLDFCPAAQC